MAKNVSLTITTVHSVYACRDAGIYLKLVADTVESDIIRLKHKKGWHKSPLLRKWERDPVETFLSLYKEVKRKRKEKEGGDAQGKGKEPEDTGDQRENNDKTANGNLNENHNLKENDDVKENHDPKENHGSKEDNGQEETEEHLEKTEEDSEGLQTFQIKLPKDFPVVETRKIEIGHDHSRFVDGWLIGRVTLKDSDGTELHFKGPSSYGDWHRGTLTLMRTPDHITRDAESIVRHRFVMGPILGYCGTKDRNYQLCCLVATEGQDEGLPPLHYKVTKTRDGQEVIVEGRTAYLASPLAVSGDYKLWRYDWKVPRHRNQDYVCRYTLPDNRSFMCHIPSFNTYPRIVFGSCAGLETQEEIREASDSNVMWIHMRLEHAKKPFHILILGGDQVYADPIIVNLKKERKARGIDETDTTGLLEEARAKYFELYISRWRQPEQACMLSRIPSFMMWDDHDIFDGWGSFREITPFMEETYKAARENFNLFQLRGLRREAAVQPGNNRIYIGRHSMQWIHPPFVGESDPNIDQGPFSYIVTFGDVCIMVLDNRSERKIDQAMSDESWQEFVDVLKALRGFKHIFIAICVPLIYANFHCLMTLIKNAPVEEIRNLEDDIIDHWGSPHHDYERRRFYKTVLDFCKETNTRVTVLSGDVHVGCWGKLKSDSGISMDMVTSSALVNKPPPLIKFLFEALSRDERFYLPKHGKVKLWLDEVDDVDKTKRVIARQNFLELDPEETEKGEYTGRYRADFVKKPSEIFEKSKPKKFILKKPEIFGRIIESTAVVVEQEPKTTQDPVSADNPQNAGSEK
ncbi:uncharacterized protein [Ptychodera flava]|uniref:uncharacterized protein n=1 Tax=Ptychodera flava TaxID=63121 RepID=UPI003969C0A0